MRSYRIPIVVISIIVVAAVVGPGIYDRFPHTYEAPEEQFGEILRDIFFRRPLPSSIHVEACAVRLSPAGKDFDAVLGCALTVRPEDFQALLDPDETVQQRAVAEIRTNLEMPLVGKPFQISHVYYTSPPEDWGINTQLIYTDKSRSRIVVYCRQFMVVD